MEKIKTGILVLCFGLLLAGCNPNLGNTACPKQDCPVPQEKALVSLYSSNWGENIDNSNKNLFKYTIYNYGLVEAKNVSVKCYVEDNGKIDGETEQISNLASSSMSFKEMDVKRSSYDQNALGMCYIVSCGSDCIILDDRIPENIKYKK